MSTHSTSPVPPSSGPLTADDAQPTWVTTYAQLPLSGMWQAVSIELWSGMRLEATRPTRELADEAVQVEIARFNAMVGGAL